MALSLTQKTSLPADRENAPTEVGLAGFRLRPEKSEPGRPHPDSVLLEALVDCQFLTPDQGRKASENGSSSEFIGETLTQLGWLNESDLAAAISSYHHLPLIELEACHLTEELFSLVPVDFCLKYRVLPLARVGNFLSLGVVNPFDRRPLEEISQKGLKPLLCLGLPSDFTRCQEKLTEMQERLQETLPETAEKSLPVSEPTAPETAEEGEPTRLHRLRLIGEKLLIAGRIKKELLEEVMRLMEEDLSLSASLRELEKMDGVQEFLAAYLCEILEKPFLNIFKYNLNDNLVEVIPRDFARHHLVVPLARAGNQLTVAAANPLDLPRIDELRRLCGLGIQSVIGAATDIRLAIATLYPEEQEKKETKQETKISIKEAEKDESLSDVLLKLRIITPGRKPAKNLPELSEQDVINISDILLADAIRQHASDIHIEPFEENFKVRYRLDGEMRVIVVAPSEIHAPLNSRLKILSNLDIAEHRIPQDGRLKVSFEGRDIDFRVSSLPTIFGEKIVMRILDKKGLKLDLGELGFDEQNKVAFIEAITKPNGIVLVTGPTGSGKSTTLYSALGAIQGDDVNITTLEDPVEYNIEGINQVQCNPKAGLTFASGLRSILRQDPDVVMIGEIRDSETASIAIRAALTGHLVLSTLHTNDAPSAVSRLVDMSCEPYLLAASLLLVQAQRLVRVICANCKRQVKLPADTFQKLKMLLPKDMPESEIVAYAGQGCRRCNFSGYKGRTTLVEVFSVKPEIKDLIAGNSPLAQIKAKAIELGMQNLLEDGVKKVILGKTTIEEVFTATAS